jgi:hypothetical protein
VSPAWHLRFPWKGDVALVTGRAAGPFPTPGFREDENLTAAAAAADVFKQLSDVESYVLLSADRTSHSRFDQPFMVKAGDAGSIRLPRQVGDVLEQPMARDPDHEAVVAPTGG